MYSDPNLTISIQEHQLMSEEQRQALDQMIHLSFAAEWGPLPEGAEHIDWAQPQIHMIGWQEGRPVSHVGILWRTVSVQGQALRVGGIGSVCTHPDFLRRGYAHRLMGTAHDFMVREKRCEFAMLFCAQRTVSLYQDLGYAVIDSPLWMDQPNGRRLFDSPKMVLPLTNLSWPEGEIDIQGLPW